MTGTKKGKDFPVVKKKKKSNTHKNYLSFSNDVPTRRQFFTDRGFWYNDLNK